MEKLKLHQEKLLLALKTLEEALELLAQQEDHPQEPHLEAPLAPA